MIFNLGKSELFAVLNINILYKSPFNIINSHVLQYRKIFISPIAENSFSSALQKDIYTFRLLDSSSFSKAASNNNSTLFFYSNRKFKDNRMCIEILVDRTELTSRRKSTQINSQNFLGASYWCFLAYLAILSALVDFYPMHARVSFAYVQKNWRIVVRYFCFGSLKSRSRLDKSLPVFKSPKRYHRSRNGIKIRPLEIKCTTTLLRWDS